MENGLVGPQVLVDGSQQATEQRGIGVQVVFAGSIPQQCGSLPFRTYSAIQLRTSSISASSQNVVSNSVRAIGEGE